MDNQLLTASLEHLGRDVVVRLAGEIDLATVPLMDKALADAAAAEPPAAVIIVDLTQVDFLGSAGLAVLLAASQRGTDAGVPVVVSVPPTGAARRAIAVTGVDGLLTLADDLDQARRQV